MNIEIIISGFLLLSAGFLYFDSKITNKCKCGGTLEKTFRDKQWCIDCGKGN